MVVVSYYNELCRRQKGLIYDNDTTEIYSRCFVLGGGGIRMIWDGGDRAIRVAGEEKILWEMGLCIK